MKCITLTDPPPVHETGRRAWPRVRHIEHGDPVNMGRAYHSLEVWTGKVWQPIAQVQALVMPSSSGPVVDWFVCQRQRVDQSETVYWSPRRHFTTEGDAIDALWRLQGLYKEGFWPLDIEDAI